MSVALLFEGNNELPRFDAVGQQDLLWEESFHIGRDVQIFTLHVTHKCVFKATGTKTHTENYKLYHIRNQSDLEWIWIKTFTPSLD